MTKKTINQNDFDLITRIVEKLFKPLGLVDNFLTINFDKPTLKEIEYHDTVYFFSKELHKNIFIVNSYSESTNYSEYSVLFNGDKWVFTWLLTTPATRHEPENSEVKESIEYNSFNQAFNDLILFILNEYITNLQTNDDFIIIEE